MSEHHHRYTLRERWHRRLFDTHTRSGHRFEIIITLLIILSVLTVTLETVAHLDDNYPHLFAMVEWFFTILFTIEFAFRLYTAADRWKYLTSFFGLVDLLSILPTYILIFLP